jgi:hypothetical protein
MKKLALLLFMIAAVAAQAEIRQAQLSIFGMD